jgi:LacI family transcriptional regulator
MTTIYDVAKSAGVSPKTVSRVLNGDGPVGQKTRDLVEKTIADLRYVPSSAARAMRSNRSGLVGVISGAISDTPDQPQLAGLPETHILRGIQDVLEATGRSMLLADTAGRSDRVPSLLRTLAEHRVDGVIYVAPFHQKVSLTDVDAGPFVIANGYDELGTPSVVPDDYSGQKALIDGLIARGHRRLAYLQLPPDLDATKARTKAFFDAHAEAGLQVDPEILQVADAHSPDPDVRVRLLHKAIGKVLEAPVTPSVICCGNDRMALAVYGILRSRGLRIPEDISVVGYDDCRLVSETLYPTLTTVELPYYAIGRRAAELLTAPAAPTAPAVVRGEVRWRDSARSI